MGQKRVAWMQHEPVDPHKVPLGERTDRRSERHTTIRSFIEAYSPDSTAVRDLLANDVRFWREVLHLAVHASTLPQGSRRCEGVRWQAG